MLYMIFQYDYEPVLIQRILIGLKAIKKNISDQRERKRIDLITNIFMDLKG